MHMRDRETHEVSADQHLQLGPRVSCVMRLLLQLGRISLGPLPHRLALDLAAGQLGHLVDEDHAAGQLFVLGHPRRQPFLDVAGGYFAL